MSQTPGAEPPSCPQLSFFRVGQDSRGNWVVQDQNGCRGGLFVNRAAALRYVRLENGNRPHSFVVVTGILELDTSRMPAAPARRRNTVAGEAVRRVA
jgi:hypothetical protein